MHRPLSLKCLSPLSIIRRRENTVRPAIQPRSSVSFRGISRSKVKFLALVSIFRGSGEAKERIGLKRLNAFADKSSSYIRVWRAQRKLEWNGKDGKNERKESGGDGKRKRGGLEGVRIKSLGWANSKSRGTASRRFAVGAATNCMSAPMFCVLSDRHVASAIYQVLTAAWNSAVQNRMSLWLKRGCSMEPSATISLVTADSFRGRDIYDAFLPFFLMNLYIYLRLRKFVG